MSNCSPCCAPQARLTDRGKNGWQPLAEHLRNVANLAKQFAVPLGLPAEAELAGLLHDLGKSDFRTL
ncbi:MAG: HD domain-containing protein [Limisphaerales bacterium]